MGKYYILTHLKTPLWNQKKVFPARVPSTLYSYALIMLELNSHVWKETSYENFFHTLLIDLLYQVSQPPILSLWSGVDTAPQIVQNVFSEELTSLHFSKAIQNKATSHLQSIDVRKSPNIFCNV